MASGAEGGGGEGEGGVSESPFNFLMSQADVKLVKECRDEAFYSRSLPIMIALSGATHVLVKAGKLAPHPKFGSILKVFWAAFFGNIIGKISYQSICNEKLKADPNSLLGRSLRQRTGQTVLEPTDPAVIDMIKKRDSPAAAVDDNAASGYDELRRRNRQYGSSSPPPPAAAPTVSSPPTTMPTENDGIEEIPLEERPMNRRMPIPRPKLNKYGDVVEDD